MGKVRTVCIASQLFKLELFALPLSSCDYMRLPNNFLHVVKMLGATAFVI